MMPYIAPDYFRREMLIDLLSVHDISPRTVFLEGLIYARRQTTKRAFRGVSPVFHRHNYMVAQKLTSKSLWRSSDGCVTSGYLGRSGSETCLDKEPLTW